MFMGIEITTLSGIISGIGIYHILLSMILFLTSVVIIGTGYYFAEVFMRKRTRVNYLEKLNKNGEYTPVFDR